MLNEELFVFLQLKRVDKSSLQGLRRGLAKPLPSGWRSMVTESMAFAVGR